MRNADRLPEFYTQMCALHEEHVPDWRIGQMISNFAKSSGDFFYLEEEEFLTELEKFLIKVTKK